MALRLVIKDLQASYGAVRALNGLSATVAEGETVVLLGTNGNGKSTLMKCIMGMIVPVRGTISLEIDGQVHDLVGLGTEKIVELGLAIVPEGRRLFPKLTVEENLLLGAFRPSARKQISNTLAFVYGAFPVLKECKRQLTGTMSGGQQQMVAIARAIMAVPRLLLVDEPSVGLSPLLVHQTIEKLKELKDRFNLTILMAEQNFEQASRIADRGYIIVHGEIVFEGRDIAELRNNDIIRKLYLGI